MSTHTSYPVSSQRGSITPLSVTTSSPGPNEVVVRIHTSALNPIDAKQHQLGLMVSSWPHLLGAEGAGTVTAVGSSITDFAVDDEVIGMFGFSPASKSLQDIAVVPAQQVTKKPKTWTWSEGASAPSGFMTALSAVTMGLHVPVPFLPSLILPGTTTIPKSVLVLGGSSAVGSAALQILRLALPQAQILTTASAKHFQRLRALGASGFFDYTSSTLVNDVRAATPSDAGVDIILDCVGSGAEQTDIVDTLRRTQDASTQTKPVYVEVVTGREWPAPEWLEKRSIFGHAVFAASGGEAAMQTLTKLAESGQYKLGTDVRVIKGWEGIEGGLKELAGGVSGMKLVVEL